MADTSHTFLDATGPTDGKGKISFPTTSTVVIEDPATKLKKALTGRPVMKSSMKPKGRPKLVSLDAWNASRSQPEPEVHKNGIACPKCKKELYDVDSTCHSNFNGTFKRVACECGWAGERKV